MAKLSGACRRSASHAAAIAALGVLLSMLPPFLELEESVGLGWLFTARGPADAPAEAVVVSLAGESADVFGLSSDVDEWPRGLHAELIDRLAAAGAAVIAFDIIFDQPRAPDGDTRLADAVRRAGNVVLLERVRSEQLELDGGPAAVIERRDRPIEALLEGALATAPFTLPVVPIRVSQFWTFGRAAGETPTLPAVALHAYALPVHAELVELLRAARPALAAQLADVDAPALKERGLEEVIRDIRELFVADPALGADLLALPRLADLPEKSETLLRSLIALYAGTDSRYLNYYGPARSLDTIAYHEVLEGKEDELADRVQGRVVFVGFSERRQPEQQDAFFSVFSERSGHNLSGVEIGATAFANLLHRDSIRPLPLPRHWVLVAAWGALIGALCVLLRGFAAAVAALAAGAFYAAAAHFVFQANGLWLPLAVPLGAQLPTALLTGLLTSYRRLHRQRERIQGALGYYLPARVVERLAQETAGVEARREVVFGTCLVTDAEQYTTLSENLHPQELGELMNAYYDVLVEAVDRHGGVVSDIGGDSMVAVWPTVHSVGSTYRQACSAALDVLEAVEAFNRRRVRRELPTRIGLDSGQLLLGNVGAAGRGEYRAVGDIVNTASRLQGLNRLLGTRVLLSGAIADDASGLLVRPLGEFLLVGKTVPVRVLELQGCGADGRDAVQMLNEQFEEALATLRLGRWTEASRAFDALLRRFPGDGPSRFFAEQCAELAARHPDGSWDGVVRVYVK